MKPVSASDILRKSAPRETVGKTFMHANRYDKLREPSPSPFFRDRTESTSSQKRKVSESDTYENESQNGKTKVSRMDDTEVEEMVILDSKISKVSTLCGKLYTNVQQQQLEVDDPLRCLLTEIIEAIRVTNEVQSDLSDRYKKIRTEEVSVQSAPISYSAAVSNENYPSIKVTTVSGKPGSHNSRKKLSGGLIHAKVDESGRLIRDQSKGKPTETDEEKKVRKFTEAIRDAERSTLCFNLDMGNIPIMNQKTISEKATLALTKMAAAVEGNKRSLPSADAIAAIDDVTSLVTNMEFYGSATKEYKGKDSTGYCTVPVRYQFKNKEQKFFAEKKLRDVCKVKCATPYPAIVRLCIKQVVDHVRLSHPQDFVRVTVVPKEFSLKVSRRPPGTNLKWIDYPDLLRLPDEALDISAKKAPDGLRMFFLPSEGCEEMCTSPSKGEKPKSPRGGRESPKK